MRRSLRGTKGRFRTRGGAGGGGGSPITISLIAEYVDGSGVRQRQTITEGSTITIPRYTRVSYDASGTRSTAPDCDTLAGICIKGGFRLHYGENLGTTWTHSGLSKDEDNGFPIFDRVYTTAAGTKINRLRVKDTNDAESTLTFNVVITDLGTPTHLTSGWGTLVSGGYYTADVADATSWGTPNTDGKHNIRIHGIGGSPTVMGVLRTDSRNNQNSAPVTRSKNIYVINMDVAEFSNGSVGHDYCGVIGGRCRTFTADSGSTMSFYFSNHVEAQETVAAANVRYSRGTTLWDCGEINEGSSGYCYIGSGRATAIYGCDLHKAGGGSGQHPMRTYECYSSSRHNRVRNSVASVNTWIKGSAGGNYYQATPIAWRDDDAFGDYTTSRQRYIDNGSSRDHIGAYGYGAIMRVHADLAVGSATDQIPVGCIHDTPQNNSGGTPPTEPYTSINDNAFEALELTGYENVKIYHNAAAFGGRQGDLTGKDLFFRNVRIDQGTGAYVNATQGTQYEERCPTGWNGPYHYEQANTRKVTTPFS